MDYGLEGTYYLLYNIYKTETRLLFSIVMKMKGTAYLIIKLKLYTRRHLITDWLKVKRPYKIVNTI